MQEPYTLVQNHISCLSLLIFAVKSRKCEFCPSLLYEWFSLMYKMGHRSTNLKMGQISKKSQNFWKIQRFFMLVSEWMETDVNRMLNWKYCITFMFSLENKIKSIKPNFDTITECEWLFLPFAIYISAFSFPCCFLSFLM